MYFREKRCVQKSIAKHLNTELNSAFTDINVVLTWKDALQASRPVVCVNLESTESSLREIGTTQLNNSHLITIDIYAKSRGQAMDLADFIKDKVRDCFDYYLFSHSPLPGNYDALEETKSGKVRTVKFLRDEPIDFGDTSDERDRFRHTIAIQVKVTPNAC